MKVAVDIWTMDSQPGYVPSYGRGDVRLVPPGVVADINGDKMLYDSTCGYPTVAREQVEEAEPYSFTSGACEYEGVRGLFDVPDDVIAVQVKYYNVSTDNGPRRYAQVLNGPSLKALYQERAERYVGLAATID